jgi:two-component system response regulator HydG
MILKKATILIVDDDTDVLTAVKLLLKTEAQEVITEKNPENLNWLLQRNQVDLVLLDMNFNSAINTGNEGLYWLNKIKEWKPNVCVIMITAYGDIDLAVRSLKEGANDFIVKPWHNEKLIEAIKLLLEKKEGVKPKTPVKSTAGDTSILGESDVMQDIFYKVNKIAPTDANILLLGENGTGKDLMAKAIHERSLRADKPFVKVDVGALTDTCSRASYSAIKKALTLMPARTVQAGLRMQKAGLYFWMKLGISAYSSKPNY